MIELELPSTEKVTLINKELISLKANQIITFQNLNEHFLILYLILKQTLDHGNSDDDFITLTNDTLSICLLRISQFSKANKEASFALHFDLLFDYIRMYQNHPYHKVVSSVNTLLAKLLNLVSDDSIILVWIKMQINCSISKNYFNTLDQLVKSCHTDTAFILELYSSNINDWMGRMDSDLANSISKTIFAILSKCKYTNLSAWFNIWKDLIFSERTLTNDPVRQNLFLHLLPKLMKIDTDLVELIQRHVETIDLPSETRHDVNLSISLTSMDLLLAPASALDTSLLIHSNSKLRLKSLAVLFGGSSPKKAKSLPISSETFKAITSLKLIEVYLNDENVETRNLFVSLFSQFVTSRLKESRLSMQKELKKNGDVAKKLKLESYSQFLKYLLNLLISYLVPSSNYSQLITSLQLMETLSEELKFFEDDRSYHYLIQCLFNNYENVRELSFNLLIGSHQERLANYLTDEKSEELIQSSFPILRSLTGRKSEGGCKFMEFLALFYIKSNEPQRAVELLNRILKAIEVDWDVFSHGFFKSASLILVTFETNLVLANKDEFQAIYSVVALKEFGMWNLVKTLLANDNFDDENDTDDLLSNYAWRVVKDSNQLLNTILTTCTFELLSIDQFLKCSDLIIEQLSSVKHRGAFSSIYPSFIELCKTCYSRTELQNFPNEWLANNIKLIVEKTQYVSRRSGGLPFLISGVLIAATTSKIDGINSKDLTSKTISKLLEVASIPYTHIAEEKNDIPQVHAFNCIKQIFIESALNGVSLNYVELALALSLNNFESKNWSIRNCAVMLFNSIQQRVFGNQKKAIYSFDLFFNKFPNIEKLLLENLTSLHEVRSQNQLLFPILIILLKLDTTGSQNLITLTKFKTVLMSYLNHQNWKIREMIARCIVSLFSSEELAEFATTFVKLEFSPDLNKIHGSLLVILGSIDKVEKLAVFTDVFGAFLDIFNRLPNVHLLKTYMVIITKLSQHLETLVEELTHDLEGYLVEHLSREFKNENQYLYAEIYKFIIAQGLAKGNNLSDLIRLGLKSIYLEVQTAAIEFIENNFDALNAEILKTALWESISDANTLGYSKVKILRLYSIGLEKYRFSANQTNEVEVLESLSVCGNEDLRVAALECLGSFTRAEDYLELVGLLLNENAPFQHRYSGTRAIILSLKNPYLAKEGLTLLMFSKVLHDDDKDIRTLGAGVLSNFKLNPYSVVNNIVESGCGSERVRGLFEENLGTGELHSQGKALFDVEPVNLYKNEVLYAQDVIKLLGGSTTGLPELKALAENDVKTLFQLLKSLGPDSQIGWSRDASLFNAFVKVILNYNAVFGSSRQLKEELLKFNVDQSILQYLA